MKSKPQKEKKEKLRTRDPEKYYRNLYWACWAGKWAAIVLPLAVVLACRANVYFPVEEVGTTIKTSFGVGVLGVVGGIAAFNETRKKKEDGTNKVIGTAIGWGLATAIVYLLSVVLKDALLISGSEFAGQAVASVFRFGMTRNYELRESYRKADINARAFKKQMESDNSGSPKGGGNNGSQSQIPVD